MKITIDLRSALVGLVAGIVVTLTLGAATALPSASGRYAIAAGGAQGGYLVDSSTGQVWSATDAEFKKPKKSPHLD